MSRAYFNNNCKYRLLLKESLLLSHIPMRTEYFNAVVVLYLGNKFHLNLYENAICCSNVTIVVQ